MVANSELLVNWFRWPFLIKDSDQPNNLLCPFRHFLAVVVQTFNWFRAYRDAFISTCVTRKNCSIFQQLVKYFALPRAHKRAVWIEWSNLCKSGICSTIGKFSKSCVVQFEPSQLLHRKTVSYNKSENKCPVLVP